MASGDHKVLLRTLAKDGIGPQSVGFASGVSLRPPSMFQRLMFNLRTIFDGKIVQYADNSNYESSLQSKLLSSISKTIEYSGCLSF